MAGCFVDGSTRGWRSGRRLRLRSSALPVVLRRDDRRSRPRRRHSLPWLHGTGALVVLICLASVSCWTRASGAGRDPTGSHRSPSSNRLPAAQNGEGVAGQVDGDRSEHDQIARPPESSPWPCRLIIPPSLQRVVEAGWEHSPTFRGQCQRLAEAGAIVMLDAFTLPKSRPARAGISIYSDGSVVARVTVPLNARTLELVAHELEHVLEQVDGVNLAVEAALSRSLMSRSGTAVRLPGGEFETRRAIEAGLRVAAEFRSATDAR